MNIVVAIRGAQVFLGANQVVHKTNHVVHTTLRPSENTTRLCCPLIALVTVSAYAESTQTLLTWEL